MIPDDLFYSLLSIPAAEKPILNLSFYRSTEMQDVLERARTSTDRTERIALYQESTSDFPQRCTVGAMWYIHNGF